MSPIIGLIVGLISSLVIELILDLVIRFVASLVAISATGLAVNLLGCLCLMMSVFSNVFGHGASCRNVHIFSHRPHGRRQTVEDEIYSQICIKGQ